MIVIAYKKDYSTSCRGCTMDRYGSDFKLHHFVSEAEAVEWCAELSASTRLEQDQGKDAWDFYFIQDGFEKAIQEAQCFDPEREKWTSQGEFESFFKPSAMDQINAKSESLYAIYVDGEKQRRADEEKKRQQDELNRKIAQAKKLIEQHPESFKETK